MPFTHDGKIVIAVTSRALFEMSAEHEVFLRSEQEFIDLQTQKFNEPPPPGAAFSLVRKLLGVNTEIERHVEVVFVSRNDPVSGLRAYHACEHYELDITRGVFTSGRPPYKYLKPFRSVLFLSADENDVRAAILAGHAAAQVYPRASDGVEVSDQELRIAFDGDAVLFGDEAERVYQSKGLAEFHRHEKERKDVPLPPGPFQKFIKMLRAVQQNETEESKIRIVTALVTARDAPAHERAIRTLMDWNIEIDEALFLGGLPKDDFLREFRPDIFFDDQQAHCDPASKVVSTGLVYFGPTHEGTSEAFDAAG